MKKGQQLQFALWSFLIGIVVIVFLQVLSGQNINRLINGNKSLLNELQIQNDLRRIESDILTIESDIRGAVISENALFLSNVQSKIKSIDEELNGLERMLSSANSADEVNRLDRLVKQKIAFSNEILHAFYKQGKEAAEAVINTGRGRALRDSIVQVTSYLDSVRQSELRKIAVSTENSGTQARTWGFVLAGLACVFVVLGFSYIVNQSRQQQKVIESLNESEKRIKEAARLKEQFMANMSHEIRTPMNAILGFTSLLRRTILDANQRQYVQSIHSAGENLLALINDILDLSKIEAGMMGIEETNFSLRSLADSVSAMFTERIKEKGLDYHLNVEEEVPDILNGDAVRLTQILVNLINNAVKFTEKGAIQVNIHSVNNTEDTARLRITVADTGIGIPKEKQAAIFERFQQADTATTRKFGGTGLGLSIVKQLVELQGGTISLKSEPGVGSEFIVEIEYKQPSLADLESAALAAAENEPIEISKVRVLIAEDNPMNQHLIKHLMKNWGIEYNLVNNGAEAVEALKQEAYSIVLMDIQMPEMDGYVATGIIRNEMKLNIPIIAMTAHAMIGEKEKCLQLGMNDYVSKPIKETILFNVIARHAQQPAGGI